MRALKERRREETAKGRECKVKKLEWQRENVAEQIVTCQSLLERSSALR